ncbi:hypothetical protein BH11CYA1_BH11CYA1_40240 [soil metagenome]
MAMKDDDDLPSSGNESTSQSEGSGQNSNKAQTRDNDSEPASLVDELGIVDIYEPMADLDGKVFCTAGRDTPVAEFEADYLILHPPQLPFYDQGPAEDIVVGVDDRGIVLNELGVPKKIPTAKYQGFPIYYFGEQKEGTLKHYATVLTADERLVFIYNDKEERLTTDDVFKLRNKSVNGEISQFPGLSCIIDDNTIADERVDASAMVNTDIEQ